MLKWKQFSFATLVLAVASFTAAGCGSDAPKVDTTQGEGDGELSVIVNFYPVQEIAQTVGGAHVKVTTLIPPGEEAHEYELTSQQLELAQKADVVLYLGDGFQPAVEKLVTGLPKSVVSVDLLSDITLLDVTPQLAGVDGETRGETLGDGKDPHVWLDPANMATMAERVAQELAVADPSHASDYEANAKAYTAKLTALGEKMDQGLETCDSKVIVTSHRAFEYLAARFGLRQIAIAGISPATEPSAKTLESVAKAAKADNVKVIYFEDSLPGGLSKTVASEIGVKTDVLDPVETLSDAQIKAGATYITVQEANLQSLKHGLGCQ